MFYFLAIPFAVFVIHIFLEPLVTYFIDRHGLRKYPGPFIAALTPWYIVYHSWTRKRYLIIDRLHAHYGPVVRISPNHISFTDPQAFRDIHGHGVSILKDDFYAHVAGGNPSMAQTTSRAEHSRKRRFMAHVFSPKEITAMEPRVQEVVGKLVKCLKVKAAGGMIGPEDAYPTVNGALDLRPWMNMTSYDAITSMFFSSSYGFLDKGNDRCPAMSPTGETYSVHAQASFHGTTSHLIPLAPLPGSTDKLMKSLQRYSRGAKHVANFGAMVRYLVTCRMQQKPISPDLFSSLPIEPTPKRPEPIPFREVMAECTTMLDAGNDTTQTSLTNCMFLLATNHHEQTKLRSKLRAALRDSSLESSEIDPVQSYQRLQHIPYLRAVLDESFRCRPPVAYGLPRRTIEDTMIAGHHIPANVTISAPMYNICKDASLFTKPAEFIPQRWLTTNDAEADDEAIVFAAEHESLRTFVLPFSLGGRACIGRNLAYMELSIVIAALVLSFEWDVAYEWHGNGKGMGITERLNANPQELWVKARAL